MKTEKKSKKPIKSDIGYTIGDQPLSENRLMVKYQYVYIDDKTSNRLFKKHKKERRVGWKQYDADSVVVWGDNSHLWIYTGFWKREKPRKKIKMTDKKIG